MLDRFIVDGLFRTFGEVVYSKNSKISIYFIIAILLIMNSQS